jgi:Putative Actinobacterial Holin-X, holin superfamily III
MDGVTPPEELRDESMGALFKKLSEDLSTLVRQELELAKVEASEKGKRFGIGFGMWGGAGLVGLLALGALTAALILALALVLPEWAAALIVGAAYLAIAGGLYLAGKERVDEAMPAKPEQTIETVKEDVQWAKTQIGSGTR